MSDEPPAQPPPSEGSPNEPQTHYAETTLGGAGGMSGTETILTNIDLREQIARIDRAQAETRKFVAEQQKLTAEGAKLARDRAVIPLNVTITLIGATAAVFAAGAAFFKLLGH